jgi:organic hydroperoxide reductase OsmC/OhrA
VSQAQRPDEASRQIRLFGIGPDGRGGFGLEVELHVSIPGVDATTGKNLLERTHQVCPYSNATRGNIPVTITFEEQLLV